MTRFPWRAWLVVPLALSPALAAAQAPAFVVERPSFSTPPQVVGAGFWQAEAGLAQSRDTTVRGSVNTLSVPNLVLRLGVNRRLELRAATSGVVHADTPRARTTSMSDLGVGVKYQFATQAGVGLDVALVPMLSVPTGGAASSRNVDPSVILSVARGHGTASTNLNVKWSAPSIGEAANERAQWLDVSLVTSVDLTPSWSAFVEGVSRVNDVVDQPTQWIVNAGLGRALGTTLRVDAFGGRGLNDAAPAWTFGLGLGWRFRR